MCVLTAGLRPLTHVMKEITQEVMRKYLVILNFFFFFLNLDVTPDHNSQGLISGKSVCSLPCKRPPPWHLPFTDPEI